MTEEPATSEPESGPRGTRRKVVARLIPAVFVLVLGTVLARALLYGTWAEAAWFGVLMAICNVIAMFVAGAFKAFDKTQA